MNQQIPRGSEDFICPLHSKKMSLVCHKCPWWQKVVGVDSNTGHPVDRWDCAIALLPMLTINTANQSREAGAATESMRNEIVARMDGVRPTHPRHTELASPPLKQLTR